MNVGVPAEVEHLQDRREITALEVLGTRG